MQGRDRLAPFMLLCLDVECLYVTTFVLRLSNAGFLVLSIPSPERQTNNCTDTGQARVLITKFSGKMLWDLGIMTKNKFETENGIKARAGAESRRSGRA